MIQVEHLTKQYIVGKPALEDVTFTIKKGGVWGLLGPNGAGKSTLMNIITGYLSATEGRVVINGLDITQEPAKVKAMIGYLPEIPPLYPEMGVEEYLCFVAELKGIRQKKQRNAQVKQVMDQMGLATMNRRLIRNLSKGYRQRTGLAGALLGSPEIIILDEPTVGLDPAQMIEMRQMVRQLGQEHTVILSSHILSEVQSVCDQVLILSEGKLAAQGTPDSLGKKELYLHLTIQGSVERAKQLLETIDGLEVIHAEQKGEEAQLSLRSALGKDLRRSVSLTLAKGDCPVLSMTTETPSLEESFLRLTEKKTH